MKIQGVTLVDPTDAVWLAKHLARPAHEQAEAMNGDGVCFATFNDELLGPFSCKADASAAQDQKLKEMRDAGIDLLAVNPVMCIVFGDPTVYHVPDSERPNG